MERWSKTLQRSRHGGVGQREGKAQVMQSVKITSSLLDYSRFRDPGGDAKQVVGNSSLACRNRSELELNIWQSSENRRYGKPWTS